MREAILKRFPPGDRWVDIKENTEEIFISLTEGLQYAFETTGCTEFHIDAKEGRVYVVRPDPVKQPEPPKQFSLYGEE